jgi:hypothetical protein
MLGCAAPDIPQVTVAAPAQRGYLNRNAEQR